MLAVAIPLSEFLMSVSQLILAANWFFEGNFKNKFSLLKTRKSILFFVSIIAIHLIWLINTTDFTYAFHDIRVKGPILILPVIIGTSGILTIKQTKILILFFVAAVIGGSLVSLSILLGILSYPIDSFRDISIYISHIRFSLMIVFAIFVLYYFIFKNFGKLVFWEKIIYAVLIIWLIVFLYLLQSLSGIFIFIIITIVLLFSGALKFKKIYLKFITTAMLLVVIAASIFYIYNSVKQFYEIEEITEQTIDKKTKQDNLYVHDFKSKLVENGTYTNLYICEKEMIKTWNKISDYKYWEKDKKGQKTKYTLIRYLTSKGLRKDAEGVKSLSKWDIENIENGIANYIFTNKYSISAIIYKLIWEVDVYFKTGNPNNHSVAQRLEYLKAAKGIIKDNFWFGIGTGDIKIEFKNQYEKMLTKLDENNQRRAHNQYVTLLLTFGVFGFIYLMIALFAPYFMHKEKHHLLFFVLMSIIIFSMVNEDTLETQPGITFFAFFYSVFLYAWNKEIFTKH